MDTIKEMFSGVGILVIVIGVLAIAVLPVLRKQANRPQEESPETASPTPSNQEDHPNRPRLDEEL